MSVQRVRKFTVESLRLGGPHHNPAMTGRGATLDDRRLAELQAELHPGNLAPTVSLAEVEEPLSSELGTSGLAEEGPTDTQIADTADHVTTMLVGGTLDGVEALAAKVRASGHKGSGGRRHQSGNPPRRQQVAAPAALNPRNTAAPPLHGMPAVNGPDFAGVVLKPFETPGFFGLAHPEPFFSGERELNVAGGGPRPRQLQTSV